MVDVVINNRVVDSSDLEAVDTMLNKFRTKPLWEGVSFLVSIFEKKHPEYSAALAQQTTDNKKDLRNKFASNKQKDLRSLLTMPPQLYDLINYFYKERINADSKKFWRSFARHYPQYATGEKI
jgi:hypothetical protein